MLSGSIPYTSRTRITAIQGGPSHTEGVESSALAVDGAGFEPFPDLTYYVGFLHQDLDRVVVAGEWAIDAPATYVLGFRSSITATPTRAQTGAAQLRFPCAASSR